MLDQDPSKIDADGWISGLASSEGQDIIEPHAGGVDEEMDTISINFLLRSRT
jgi:hypothetical protein